MKWDCSVVVSIGVGMFLLIVVMVVYWFLLELEICLENFVRLGDLCSVIVVKFSS